MFTYVSGASSPIGIVLPGRYPQLFLLGFGHVVVQGRPMSSSGRATVTEKKQALWKWLQRALPKKEHTLWNSNTFKRILLLTKTISFTARLNNTSINTEVHVSYLVNFSQKSCVCVNYLYLVCVVLC